MRHFRSVVTSSFILQVGLAKRQLLVTQPSSSFSPAVCPLLYTQVRAINYLSCRSKFFVMSGSRQSCNPQDSLQCDERGTLPTRKGKQQQVLEAADQILLPAGSVSVAKEIVTKSLSATIESLSSLPISAPRQPSATSEAVRPQKLGTPSQPNTVTRDKVTAATVRFLSYLRLCKQEHDWKTNSSQSLAFRSLPKMMPSLRRCLNIDREHPSGKHWGVREAESHTLY